MARDISELGADVFDDTPKPPHKISPKKRNYIIGLSISAVLLAGVVTASVILCNTALTDYSNVENVSYYFTPNEEGEKTCVLFKLKSDVKYPSTFRVPSHVKGYKVIGIADSAFAGHKEINHVVLPNTLTFVGEKSFYNCTNLSKFTWSKNLTDVGVDAFLNTAFYNNLLKDTETLYYLPSGLLIYVGKNYFPVNTALVSAGLKEEEIARIQTTYGATNVQSFEAIGINNIASGAFKNNDKVVYIDLPSHLTEVSNATFESCTLLKGLNATHSGVTAIKERAFANCSSLKDVVLPSELTMIGDEAFRNTGIVDQIPDLSHVETLGKYIFADCTKLESVEYNAKILPDYVFSGCTELDSITWDIDKVTSIGVGAFTGTAFTEFWIPKYIDTIYDETFKNCDKLETVYMYGNPDNVLIPPEEVEEEEDEDEEEIEIRTFIDDDGEEQDGTLLGVESIRSSAFEGCTQLATISLYKDNYSLFDDSEVGTFFFPKSLLRTDVSSTIAGNDNNTFKGVACEKVVMTANQLNIGSFAFEDAFNLKTVEIENRNVSRLSVISDSAFKNCISLETFELPPQLGVLSASAFYGCESLLGVDLGATNIKTINARTFYGCQNITHIDIPETVSLIKSDSFFQNYALDYVVIPRLVNEINDDAFTEMRADDTKINIYFNCTAKEDRAGYINKTEGAWCDETVQDYYLLDEDEERLPGYHYWKMGPGGVPEIIDN